MAEATIVGRHDARRRVSLTEPLTPRQAQVYALWEAQVLMLETLVVPMDLSRRPLDHDLDTRREKKIRQLERDRIEVLMGALEDELVRLEAAKVPTSAPKGC